MPAPRHRWSVAACAALVVLIPVITLLRLQGSAAQRSETLTGPATDALHAPWYGLRLVKAPVLFSAGRDLPRTPPSMIAAAGILVDLDTGRILWEMNAHASLPPASTIKLLTALLVLANFDPNQVISATASGLTQHGDESKMGLHAGDALTVRDLLTGMLTVSANDAASVLAADTVGAERFVGAMNAEVAALGLHDTHATSPVGLDAPGMYASAYDLAAIASVDVSAFPLFGSIVDTQHTVIPAGPDHRAFYLQNLNLLLHMYPAAVGIKPGWTGDAGACEVGMAVRDGHRLISVLLRGQLVYTESRRLLDWGFVQEGLSSQLPAATPPAAR